MPLLFLVYYISLLILIAVYLLKRKVTGASTSQLRSRLALIYCQVYLAGFILGCIFLVYFADTEYKLKYTPILAFVSLGLFAAAYAVYKISIKIPKKIAIIFVCLALIIPSYFAANEVRKIYEVISFPRVDCVKNPSFVVNRVPSFWERLLKKSTFCLKEKL